MNKKLKAAVVNRNHRTKRFFFFKHNIIFFIYITFKRRRFVMWKKVFEKKTHIYCKK